jgi:hypothetical protein
MGFHLCSHEYLNNFGGVDDVEIVVEINPRDVVSFPIDYNRAKGAYSNPITQEYKKNLQDHINSDTLSEQ